MAELTPEERRRIYEEEKVRMEAQASLKAKKPSVSSNCCGCAIIAGILFILFVIQGMSSPSSSSYTPSSSNTPSSSDSSSTYSPSSVPSAQVDALQKAMEESDARDKAKIVVDDQTNERDGSYTYVRGSVKNEGKWTVRYWKVTAQFFNRKGEIVDTGYTNSTETLLPGASKRFEIMQPTPPGAERAKSFVEEVQFADN